MNVYMVEDNPHKQRHLLSILDTGNRLAKESGISETLVPGFGGDPDTASRAHNDPKKLVNALEDPTAVYLVDLTLKPERLSESAMLEAFRDELRAKKTSWCDSALKHFDTLATSDTYEVRDASEKCRLAVQFLCCCHAAEKPAIIASTETIGMYIDTITRLDLAGALGSFPSAPQGTPDPAVLEMWASAILGLSDELGRIKTRTTRWFELPYEEPWQDIWGLPHDLESLDLEQHKRIVRSVLPWAPDSWWSSRDCAKALHNCLKSTLGYHAQWTSKLDTANVRPLCLAGAYLLLLVSVAQRYPGKFGDLVPTDWTAFVSDDKPIAFLPSQLHLDAAATVQSLFDFYCLIRTPKSGNVTKPGIRSVAMPTKGRRYFTFQLDWQDSEVDSFLSQFTTRISEGVKARAVELPPAKASATLLRFQIASLIRSAESAGGGASDPRAAAVVEVEQDGRVFVGWRKG